MTASKAEARTARRWPAAIVLLTLGIAAGLLSIDCTNRPAATGSTATSPPTTPKPSLIASPAPAFASVHGYITYSDGSEIWAVDPNHPTTRISLGPSHGLTPIAWSRDGSQLLLVEQRTDAGTGGIAQDLWVMNADGSQTRLTSDGQSGEGSFSPDGTKVVFARWDDGLYVVDVKGGTPRLIAKSYMAWWLESPAWSPDGSRIAYMVYLEGGPEGLTYEVWTVSPDGTNPRLLVNVGECGGGGCSGGLAWSPDGSMLAFHSMRGNLSRRIWAIYVVHADGSGLRQITDGSAKCVQPAWSPDGSRIAYFQGYGFPEGLYTIATDGSDVRHLDAIDVVPKGVGVVPPYRWAWNPVVRT